MNGRCTACPGCGAYMLDEMCATSGCVAEHGISDEESWSRHLTQWAARQAREEARRKAEEERARAAEKDAWEKQRSYCFRLVEQWAASGLRSELLRNFSVFLFGVGERAHPRILSELVSAPAKAYPWTCLQ